MLVLQIDGEMNLGAQFGAGFEFGDTLWKAEITRAWVSGGLMGVDRITNPTARARLPLPAGSPLFAPLLLCR